MRSLDRGAPYIDHIVQRIEAHRLPPEIIYLPVIESEFKTHAVSRSGAVGFWQFMRNSIDPFDIRVNTWMDERRDFWKSTEGAILKLKENYYALGDWLLALAAYNCGLGRMQRAITASGLTDFWALADQGYLPRETVHYIPKFLAIAYIASYPGRNGLPYNWEEERKWTRVPIDKPVDLRLLAKESGAPIEMLLAANAELNYGITPPGDNRYFLKVPKEYSDSIREALESDSIKLIRFSVYTIKKGDTLYDLSGHYGVTVSMIISYNPGINPSALRIGSRIIIPMLREISPYPGKDSAEAPHDPRPFTEPYTVLPGDTLWSISRRFATTPEEIARANGFQTDSILHAGRVLLLPPESNPERDNGYDR